MALLPYLLDDIQPHRYRDPLFEVSAEDLLGPVIKMRRYLRPWRSLAASARDVGSTIKTDKDKFQVNLDVQHFAPEEISVKTSDGYVIIEGKHEEKKDDHGFVSRQFKRRYLLPEDCNPESVESRLSSDGVLTILAPKVSQGKDERAVPITHTGPVRRKTHDEDDEVNGDASEASKEDEAKSPQKKRRR